MKSCADKKKPIALLALNALEAPAETKLRAHLESCAGCRQYLAEISRVTERLAAVRPNAEVRATDAFHRNLVARLNTEASAPFWKRMLAARRPVHFDWRMAVSLTAVVAGLLTVGIWQWPRATGGAAPAVRTTIPIVATGADDSNLTPTLGNYLQVADQSPEKLDDLLGQQERQGAQAPPVYTASARALSF